MAGLGKALRLDLEVTIGLAGPHDLVERIVLAGLPGSSGPGLTADSAGSSYPAVTSAEDDGLRRRLLMAVYRGEQEAPEKVSRLGGLVDTWLFASPAPLEYCRSAAVISCPAVAIQLAGEPLLGTLLSASRAGVDLAALSFDTLTEPAVSRALSMLGIAGGRAHIREQFASPASLASYHGRLWRVGQTAAAITCVEDVARRLTDSHVPVFTVRPTGPAIASGLEVATLTAGRHVLAQSQFAVAVVQVPAFRDDGGRRMSRLAQEEVLLTVQRLLVREAQRIDATVSRSGDSGFLVLGTRGDRRRATVRGQGPHRARPGPRGRRGNRPHRTGGRGSGLDPATRSAAGRRGYLGQTAGAPVRGRRRRPATSAARVAGWPPPVAADGPGGRQPEQAPEPGDAGQTRAEAGCRR